MQHSGSRLLRVAIKWQGSWKENVLGRSINEPIRSSGRNTTAQSSSYLYEFFSTGLSTIQKSKTLPSGGENLVVR